MEIKKMLLTPNRGGRPGTKIIPKALVIHWTANTNKGADAVANRNYFENNKVSAHYVVDDKLIVQCIPEDEMAYHVGSRHYTEKALKELSTYPNNCTIGIEICVNMDGLFEKALRNAVLLAADICKRHKWTKDNIWRHYDVTGKNCPKFFVDNNTAIAYGFNSAHQGWERFKADVEIAMLEGDRVFRDIESHWAKESIEKVAKMGLLKGDPNGNFRPNDPVTRAELAVVLTRLVGKTVK